MEGRPEKLAMLKEVHTTLEGTDYAILADCRGMKVEGLSELRGQLRGTKSKLYITKNTFIKHAANQLGWEDFEQYLAGPTALITGTGDISAVAKLLKEYAKTANMPTLKGGRFGERTLTPADVDAIAAIPPRIVLLGQVVGTIAAPLSQLVGVMNQKVLSLLYVLKAAADKKSNV
ncbi:MAG: 50S ribosomal protein L10 [Verrucomicrobia bacterium]|nr:50S ribosomal protein L10 [Verrucomicrobiota bacterium]